MKKWIKNIWSGKPGDPVDWKTDDSILHFLESHINPHGHLDASAQNLPDEDPADQNNIKFAPGLADAIFGIDSSEQASYPISELLQLVTKIALNGDAKSAADFYVNVTTSEGVIGIMDDFLQELAQQRIPIYPHYFAFAHDLAYKTNHRNSVKFGIAMLGLCQDKSVIPALKILALHDEFSIFSIVALSMLSDDLVNDLWELAQKLKGWGKIRLVDKLATLELTAKIKDWLLRKGYQNEIMYEYLAYTCAVKGDLNSRLEAIHIDKNLFLCAGEIIDALIAGGPAEDISDYADAASVVEQYVRHAAEHADDIASFVVLQHINDFLADLQANPEAQGKNGWTIDLLSNILIDLNTLLRQQHWQALAQAALQSNHPQTYWNGKLAAQRLGIDLWETVWQRLHKDATESTNWYDVIQFAAPGMADNIIAFATGHLPLSILGSGPAETTGIGPHYSQHTALSFLLSFLEQHPGKGLELVLTGLYSPVTRNRNLSIRLLETWGEEHRTAEIREALLRLRQLEPDTETKAELEKLLRNRK